MVKDGNGAEPSEHRRAREREKERDGRRHKTRNENERHTNKRQTENETLGWKPASYRILLLIHPAGRMQVRS